MGESYCHWRPWQRNVIICLEIYERLWLAMYHEVLPGGGNVEYSLIARFMRPTWGPSGADRTQSCYLVYFKAFPLVLIVWKQNKTRRYHNATVYSYITSFHWPMAQTVLFKLDISKIYCACIISSINHLYKWEWEIFLITLTFVNKSFLHHRSVGNGTHSTWNYSLPNRH